MPAKKTPVKTPTVPALVPSIADNAPTFPRRNPKLGHCERLCAPIDYGTRSSFTSSSAATKASSTTRSTQTTATKSKIGLRKYAALCYCAPTTVAAVFVVLLVLARIRYGRLKQPTFPDVVKFESKTEPFKAKEIKLQELEKLLDKSLKATNEQVRKDSQAKYCQEQEDERGYAMFGFYDFCLDGVDQIELVGDVTTEPEAEKPYVSGDMQVTDLEYRGKAKWSWAFSAEDFNCTTPSYNFTFKISLPHPETKNMELLEVEFPKLAKYKCNRFHRYARHSRRIAKSYTASSFRYLIQEFIVNSFKEVWESQQKGTKKKR